MNELLKFIIGILLVFISVFVCGFLFSKCCQKDKIIKRKLVVPVLLIVLILCFGGVFLVLNFCQEKKAEIVQENAKQFDFKLPGEVEKRVVTKEEIEAKISKIEELATYLGEYTVSKSAEYSRYFLDNIHIPGTTNTINIKCDGVVKVGYDVNDISIKVNSESQKIYISLPTPEVFDNYIIWDSVECEELNNIFNPIDFEQYQTLVNELEEKGLVKSEKEGIYDAAEKNVKNVIKNFLSGFDEYEVVFM